MIIDNKLYKYITSTLVKNRLRSLSTRHIVTSLIAKINVKSIKYKKNSATVSGKYME